MRGSLTTTVVPSSLLLLFMYIAIVISSSPAPLSSFVHTLLRLFILYDYLAPPIITRTETVKMTWVCGEEVVAVDAPIGKTLLQVAKDNGLKLDGKYGGDYYYYY